MKYLTLLFVLALTFGSAHAQVVNLTGRELQASSNGNTVGAGCVSSSICSPHTLTGRGVAVTFKMSGQLNSPFVLFASSTGILCSPVNALWLVSPITIASGSLNLGNFGSGCPGAAVRTINFPVVVPLWAQAAVLTPGGQGVFTTPIQF